MTDEALAAVDANDTDYAKYKLAEMLDVGLKILQLNTNNELRITTMALDEAEKQQREARIERRQLKKEQKREERHKRHEEEKIGRASGVSAEGKVVINLSEETASTSAQSLTPFAVAQQLAAQQLAVEQLTAATAASAAATVAAAMAAASAASVSARSMSVGKALSSHTDMPLKVTSSSTEITPMKVKLSLSENIQDEASTFTIPSKESMLSHIYRPESFMDWPLMGLGLGPPPPPPPTMFGLNAGGFQTVMLRNIPNKYTRTQLLRRLNVHFRGEFDFLYVPIDFNNKCNVGYAFVNFKRPESVPRFLEHFNGVKTSSCLPDYNSSKVCEVTPAHVQGLEQNIEHLRSSPISDQLRSKPEWQPLLFDAKGEAMPFPLNPNKQRTTTTTKMKKTLSTLSEVVPKDSKVEILDKNDRAPPSSGIDSDEFTEVESVEQVPERESFPKKEKRRKEKNKRTANDLEDRKLEACLVDFDVHTTAMVRYIPEELTRSTLSKRLSELFPKGSYDFLYMPIDFERNYNVGYFFIDFRDQNALKTCVETFHNKPAGEVFPDSVCEDYIEVSPARIQGLENNITNLKNSSVGAVGQSNLEWKPLLFGEDGSVEELDLAPSDLRKPEGKRKAKKPDAESDKRNSKKTFLETSSVVTRATIGTVKTDTKRHAPVTAFNTDYENFTSVMLRNLPNKYTRQMLQEQLDKMGFKDNYDFLYMPIDFKNKCNIGYAFINFRTNDGVKKCFKYFQGIDCTQCLPGFNSNKIVEVTPARVQGLEANVRHLQNSAVIEQLQDKPEWKPIVLNEKNQLVGYPWKEITTSKLNAMANVFVPRALEEEANQHWMMAMDYVYRASMGLHWPDLTYAQQPEQLVDPDTHSTVMIRNIPNKFTRDKLFSRLKEHIPKRHIDFFYMPIDFTNKCNVGYCFVNFSSPEGVRRCVEKFHNIESRICLPGFNSTKVCIVTAARVQGLQDNIAHLQHTSVFETLHNRGLDNWAPLLFDKQGNEIPFSNACVPSQADGDAPASTSETTARTSKKGKKSKKKAAASGTSVTSLDLSKEESTESRPKSLWSGSSDNFSLYYGQVLPYVEPSRGDYTTVMIRNLPADVQRHALITELEQAGIKGEFDFLYLPKDIVKEQNIGYAFVNMRSKAAVETLVNALNKHVLKGFSESVPLEVKPARVQGREANIRYLSQMDDLNTGEWAPVTFDAEGEMVPLPARAAESSMRAEAIEFLPRNSALVS